MKYDFGKYVNRRGSDSSKWDHQTGPFGAEGLLPFWVADSDFAVLPEIQQAMAKRIEHPVFGYTATPDGYFTAIENWQPHFPCYVLKQPLFGRSVPHNR